MFWDKLLTLLGRLGGAAGGLLLLGGFLTFMLNNDVVQNYLKEAVDVPELSINLVSLASRVDETKEEVQHLKESVEQLTETLQDVSDFGELSREPIIKFLEGSYITDGQMGNVVTVSVRSVKLRDCGKAELSVWLKNGQKRIHAFEDISITDSNGITTRAPGNPGEILERSFTARIPNAGGVSPGIAVGWLEVSYPDCPLVPVEVSPMMPFNILDDNGRPIEREVR